jgi:FixJ family two-component response regulator
MTNRSILVVDDEHDKARLYAEQFAIEGWNAEPAFSGAAAVEAVKARDFGVVLLDMRMPGMDGFATLAEILKVRPDQCVVFFSGFGDVDSAVKALRQGAWSMVLKDGIKFQNLCESVDIAVQRKTAEVTARHERDAAIANAAKLESNSILANGCAHTVKNRLVAVASRLDQVDTATTLDVARCKSAEAREQLGKAFLAVKRLERIGSVRNLTFSPVRVSDVFAQAIDATRQAHSHQRSPRIQFKPKVDETVHVSADRSFLMEALECIFSNSIEAMSKDGGTVEFGCESREGRVALTILDTGSGFTAEMLTAAHEPFRTTKGPANFGCGLTFAKEVIERCGGTLEYGNRLDRSGAWVRLRLPPA